MAAESRSLLSSRLSEDFKSSRDLDSNPFHGKVSASSENMGQTPTQSTSTVVAIILGFLLIGSNIQWAYVLVHNISNQPVKNYYGAQDVETIFHFDWVNLLPGKNETRYADQRWDVLFPSGGGRVALSQNVIERLSLPASVPAAEDTQKSVYQIAGYHQLHCLDKIRDMFYDVYDLQSGILAAGENPLLSGTNWDHVLHCIEAIRQGMVCRIDETLLPVKETWPPLGDGSGIQRTCKNISALRRWAEMNRGSENRQWSIDESQ